MSHRSWVQTPQGRSLAEDSPETSPCTLHSSCSGQKKTQIKNTQRKIFKKRNHTNEKKNKLGKKHAKNRTNTQMKEKHGNIKKHTHTNSTKKTSKKKSATGDTC